VKDTGKDSTGKTTDPPKITPPITTGGGGGQVSRKVIFQYVTKSVCWIVTLKTQSIAMASGELIDKENRLVMTNFHVVRGMRDFVVFFPIADEQGKIIFEREEYQKRATRDDAIKGKVLGFDRTADIALIQLNRLPPDVDSIPFAKEEPAPGDNLHSVGNPGASDALWVYTPGQVRGVHNSKWESIGSDLTVTSHDARVIEATSPTNHGDSGGPCVNDRGELVGITQGGASGDQANAMTIFIERSELERFVTRGFREFDDLKERTWVRSTRPPIPQGNDLVINLPDYVEQLKSEDAKVRQKGCQGLKVLGPDAHPAMRYLVRALDDKNEFVAQLASEALRQIGQPVPEDLKHILPALESTSPEAKEYVLDALFALSGTPEAEAAADDVLKATSDANAKVREKAFRVLGKMVPTVGEAKAVAALSRGMQDGNKRVRLVAAIGLTMGAATVRNDVGKLREMLNRTEPELRAPAALALGRLGPRGKEATADLIKASRDENLDVRRACYVALKSVADASPDLRPVLNEGIKDSDLEVRRASLEMAGKGGTLAKDLLPTIASALSDPDVRQAALKALKTLGPDGSGEALRVAELLAVDKLARKEALETLDAMKVKEVTTIHLIVPKVLAVFDDEQQMPIRLKTSETLAHLGKLAVPSIAAGLKNPNFLMRRGAAMTLGMMGREAALALDALQVAVTIESDPMTRDEEKKAWTRISSGR